MPPEIVGTHPTVRWLKRRIRHLGREQTPLVIVGEPGVGKSLVAAHIHSHGPFHDRPLVLVDIGVLSERQYRIDLLGADGPVAPSPRKSLLEHPTTLLIKHIDRAHAYVQEWLARSLSSGRVLRDGAEKARAVACRPVFAFPRHPRRMSEGGRLAGSLSCLLEQYTTIEIPPLSERTGDIPALAGALLSDCVGETLGDTLRVRQWPDNIAGLKAYLWNLLVTSHSEAERSGEREELQKMLLLVKEGRHFSLKDSLARIEGGMIVRALARSEGNQAEAARILGLTDRTIRRQLDKIV